MTDDAGRFVIRRHGKFVVVTRYKYSVELGILSWGELRGIYRFI